MSSADTVPLVILLSFVPACAGLTWLVVRVGSWLETRKCPATTSTPTETTTAAMLPQSPMEIYRERSSRRDEKHAAKLRRMQQARRTV